LSSILDALKKLEKEKDENEPDFSWPHPVNPRLTLSEKIGKHNTNKVIIGMGCAVFLVISVIYLLSGRDKSLNEAMFDPNPEKTSQASSQTALNNETIESAKAFDETVMRPPTTERNPEEDDEIPEETQVVDKESQTSIDALAALVSKKKPSSILTNIDSNPKPKNSTAGKTDDTADFNKKTAELVKKLPGTLIPPSKTVDANWLKLHAISWSSNPLNRIAVINSQIVKEGRRVEGGLVKHIEKDYVVIEKDGEELMLPFNNH
jgi:hypothetical protein